MSAVDVAVPCYNYGHFLKSCVDSVLSQRDVDVRVLIIDDASFDNTAAIGEELASRDTRVTFRRHEVNQGLIRTANEGILEWARAPYTLLLSADDALTPGSLARATFVLDRHPDAGMVYGMGRRIGDGELPGDLSDAVTPTYRILSGPRFLKKCCEYGNAVPTPTVVVRTQLQQSTGGYCVKLPQSSDMEMWMRIATLSSIGIIKDTQAYYRWHGKNMSKQYYSGRLISLHEYKKTCEHVYTEWSSDKTPDFNLWVRKRMKRWLAKRAISAASNSIDIGDWQEYRNSIAFADEMDPFWRVSLASLRLRLKRILGSTLWQKLRQLNTPLGAHIANDAIGSTFGWWPTD
jgi:glycosyltransferase involved in cell wall biosynthesis